MPKILLTGAILCAVAMVLYALINGLRMYRLIGISGQLTAESRAFERIQPGGTPRILVLGDSTAVGTGVRDPSESVAGHFGQEFANAEIWTFARNGMRTAELDKTFPAFEGATFDLVLLQIGANDIIRGTPLKEFEASLTSVFGKARAAGTHVVALHSGNIGLAPLFPWPLSAVLSARTWTYRSRYRELAAAQGVAYVDLYEEAGNDPFRGQEDVFYAPDKLHLTEAGYGHWYTQIRRVMQENNIILR